MSLKDYKYWDKTNGTLSVSMDPKVSDTDSRLYVVLNGSMGNYCLDYSDVPFDKDLSRSRAWSSDTGYYVKIEENEVIVTRWWDDYEEKLPYSVVEQKTQKFYETLLKNNDKQPGNIISFAKETFIKLRNCIPQSDNGQISLRGFMYLLAAVKDGVGLANEVDSSKWKLQDFDSDLILKHDWEWLYNAFKEGTTKNKLDVELVLRHASNRLFQEAHREATRKTFQLAFFEGGNRKYDNGISDGAFYTPTPLIRTIVQEALWALDKAKALNDRTAISILDPACGSSEFLREALRQLKIKDYKGAVSVTGWDISEIACELSNFVLHYENNSEWNNGVTIKIETQDSLINDWGKDCFDLVLMNPPFQAFENLGEKKQIIFDQLGELKARQPDLASVFWKKASEATSESGVVGLVMPHSLIGAETYKKLRAYIKEDMGFDFSLVARLGSAGLFEKAMIIPSVLVGTKKIKSRAHTILWTDHQQQSVYTSLRQLRIYRNNDIPTPIIKKEFSIYDNELATSSELETWKVNSNQMFQLSEKLASFTKVGEMFEIKQGAIAGNNAAFLLTKSEWLELPKSEQIYFRPSIMRDSIVNGQLNDSFFLFYPYGDCKILSELDLRENLKNYVDKKLDGKTISKLKARRNKKEKWWELNEHRPWQVQTKPKLVSAYFGMAGYFAFDQAGDYLVGQSFAWLPKRKEMNKNAYHFAYLGLLHSPLINKLLEMVCATVAGGQFDLSKHYVDNMPLPDLTKADNSILESLTNIGRQIHIGKEIDFEKLNQVVANAYGINIEQF